MANHYQVLEELGSKRIEPCFPEWHLQCCIGGSFGVVYKAIERATGDIVAIKHVCTPAPGRLRFSLHS